MTELPNPVDKSKPIIVEEDDVVLVIHKNGNTQLSYELSDPKGKVPVSLLFINGLALKLQDPSAVEEIIKLGVQAVEDANNHAEK